MTTQVDIKPIQALSYTNPRANHTATNGYHEQPRRVLKRRRTEKPDYLQELVTLPETTSKKQKVLLLHSPKQKYTVDKEYSVPELKHGHEVLIKVQYIG
jgi:hypothetical protein